MLIIEYSRIYLDQQKRVVAPHNDLVGGHNGVINDSYTHQNLNCQVRRASKSVVDHLLLSFFYLYQMLLFFLIQYGRLVVVVDFFLMSLLFLMPFAFLLMVTQAYRSVVVLVCIKTWICSHIQVTMPWLCPVEDLSLYLCVWITLIVEIFLLWFYVQAPFVSPENIF